MLDALTAPCVDAVNLTVGCLDYRRIRILAYGRLLERYPVLPVGAVVRLHHRQRSARSLAVLYALWYRAVVADKHMRAVFKCNGIKATIIVWSVNKLQLAPCQSVV